MFVTHSKGEVAQLHVELRAAEKGITVSRPTTEARYDLLLDLDGVIEKAQVKYAGYWRNDAVQVDLRRDTRNNKVKKTYKRDEVDAVYVYIPDKGKIYKLGPDIFDGRTTLNIRFSLPKNGQRKGLVLAGDLEEF